MSATIDAVIKDINASLPERKLIGLIERTNLSADLKALLADLAKITVQLGGKLVAIGRKILAFAFDLIKAFPTVTLGIIAALVISSLIAAIPLFGGVLAAALSSLLLVLGISTGALKDFTSDKLGARIESLVNSFSALAEI
ncbi:hypothetical protein EF888_12825 [Silicimonas algicola]|uniref:hypothetical protein n=1 Tax=Silicimonas algicola TaxID=1826607 RepID=UPI000D6B2CE1|nr:hypothetical protein [Silicimonas algicola]AZQ67942.1 hypothetical protein EF888_12825 [Silicimonas algicola]